MNDFLTNQFGFDIYSNMDRKALANPRALIVKNIINEPKIGDSIHIRDYSLFTANEAIKISKLKSIKVTDVLPIVVGTDGDYHWEYVIITDIDDSTQLLPKMYVIYN